MQNSSIFNSNDMMKRFVLYIITFFVAFVVLVAVAEVYLSHTSGNKYAYKYQQFLAHRYEINTLVLGSSYSERNINPMILGDSVYNFAIAGRWLYYDRLIVEREIPHMSNLKCVILSLSYSHLLLRSGRRQFFKDEEAKNEIYSYAKYMHLDYESWPHFLCSSALLHGKLYLNVFLDNPIKERPQGYLQMDGQSRRWQTEHNTNPDEYLSDVTSTLNENISYLEAIAQVCSRYGIRLIVYFPPFHDVYLANTSERCWNTIHQAVETISAQYPIEYFDYHDDPEFRADSIYYDCSHLNHAGACLFTRRLKQDAGL